LHCNTKQIVVDAINQSFHFVGLSQSCQAVKCQNYYYEELSHKVATNVRLLAVRGGLLCSVSRFKSRLELLMIKIRTIAK